MYRHPGRAIKVFRHWQYLHSGSYYAPRNPCALLGNKGPRQLTITPRFISAVELTPSIHSLSWCGSFVAAGGPVAFSSPSLTSTCNSPTRVSIAYQSLPMQRLGVVAFRAVAFVVLVQAQYTTPGLTTSAPLSASTTYTPTNVWAPNPTCSAGSSAVAQNGGYGGGVYRDDYGTYWEVGCGYNWSGTTYMENPGGSP